MSIFSLFTEKDILDVYEFIDNSTVKNIYKIQELQSDTNNEYNIKNVSKDGKIFSSDFNSKAQFINFLDNRKFVKFYIPLNIYCEDDRMHLRKSLNSFVNIDIKDSQNNLTTCFERGQLNRDTIDVYVNGIKLPDKSVLLSVYQGTTDVYFEASILEEENEVCFVIRNNSKSNKYTNYTFSTNRSFTGYNLSGDYSLYINGLYQTPSEYVIEDGNLYCNAEEDDICELIKEYNRTFKSDGEITLYSNIFNLHNLYDKDNILLDTLNQPLTKNNINIYIDGYRICNEDIIPLNGSFFQLKDYNIQDDINVFITYKLDENPLQENKRYQKSFYRDEYSKINNLYDLELITRHLMGKNIALNSIFPKKFTLDNMKFEFPPYYIENLIKKPLQLTMSRREFAESAIDKYMRTNNHYFFNLAYMFRNPENVVQNITIDSNEFFKKYLVSDTHSLPPYYSYEFEDERFLLIYKYGENNNFVEKIRINGKLLSRDMYDAINVTQFKTIYYYVKKECFNGTNFTKENSQNIELVIESGNYKDSKSLAIRTAEWIDTYEFDVDAIGLDKKRIDLIAFFIENENYVQYLEYGRDYKINIDCTVTILNKELLGYPIYYQNPFFTYRNDLVIDNNFIDSTIRTINLSSIVPNKKLTYSPKGSNNLEIYYDGYRLINNIDYFILEPTLYNNIPESKILFNIEIKKDKKFVFIFRERRENTYNIQEKLDSKYGLIYLTEGVLPASSAYMDFYIDNEKVKIQSLTNNLIRCKEITNQRYFAVIDCVDLPKNVLDYLETLRDFNTDSFENFFKKLLANETHIDAVFEKVKDFIIKDEFVEISDKELNIPKLDLRSDYLYEHFLLGKIDKKIDCTEGIRLYDVRYNEVFNYFNSDIISLDANSPLKKYFATLDSLENCYTTLAISELFGKELPNTEELNDGEIDNIYIHPIYKYIYEENDIILDANQETEEMYLCDANVDEEQEVIIFDCNSF